jgi:type IV pilus assembly protein PilQ
MRKVVAGRESLFARVSDSLRRYTLVRSVATAIAAVCALCFSASSAWAQASIRLEKIEATPLAGERVELRLQLSDTAPQPVVFDVDNPARISLDLPDTAITLPSRRIDVKRGGLDSVTAAELNGRTRVVLNLDRSLPYDVRAQGNIIYVLVGASSGAGSNATAAAASASAPRTAQAAASGATGQRAAAVSSGGPRSIKNIDFRRGSDGSARVIVELTDAKVPADLRQEGGRIIVTFAKTTLPDQWMRRMDVVDFATPVNTVEAVRVAEGARLVIAAGGDWEQIAYQSDNVYTIEVKPVVKVAAELEDKKEYTGSRLNLDFQDIDVRAILKVLADISGQNMVVSESVKGNFTLRLQDVPWDHALDIVMRSKGLDMRKQGNVMIIGPAAEIAAREKEILASKKEVQELAQLRTDFLQVNYAKASDLAALIKAKDNTLLSDRGNVSVDERTNTLLLQDTTDRLTEIRRLVSTLDIPVRQVQIEARIAIVNNDFSRDLGVRWGYSNINKAGANTYSVSGSATGVEDTANSVLAQNAAIARAIAAGAAAGTPPDFTGVPNLRLQSGPGAYLVNLPAANTAGRLAMAVLGQNYLVDLELSAAEAEGRGEIITAPRIVTANQREALIAQGVEIPYFESANAGGTVGGVNQVTIKFKEALLSLKVTPQITPDNRIIMDLEVIKDSVGQIVTVSNGNSVPSIDKRKLTTQVLVNDGQTVVLGGIMETEKRDSETKVPLLGDIPVLGHLFKSRSAVANKRELLVFVTPRVMKEGVALN